MFLRPLHMIVKKLVLITGIFLFIDTVAVAQQGQHDTLLRQAIIYEGDTIELKTLTPYYCYTHLTDAQRKAKQAYDRLRNAVYVTYPYARRAGIVMNDINAKLLNITGEAERKKYIHSREKELRNEFSKPLTDLSIYQGKVLMKLINRETGNNCYEIIKEYQGSLTARVYQTVAFFFNTNLKQAYDAKTEDVVIERFVMEVQRMYGYSDIKRTHSL